MLSIHSTDIDSLRICDSGVISSGNIKLQGIIATQKHNCDSNLLPIRTLFSVMSNPLWKILSTGAEEAGGGVKIFSQQVHCVNVSYRGFCAISTHGDVGCWKNRHVVFNSFLGLYFMIIVIKLHFKIKMYVFKFIYPPYDESRDQDYDQIASRPRPRQRF